MSSIGISHVLKQFFLSFKKQQRLLTLKEANFPKTKKQIWPIKKKFPELKVCFVEDLSKNKLCL